MLRTILHCHEARDAEKWPAYAHDLKYVGGAPAENRARSASRKKLWDLHRFAGRKSCALEWPDRRWAQRKRALWAWQLTPEQRAELVGSST